MNQTHWKPYGPYEDIYHNFYEASQDARGYNFGEGPAEQMSPPTVNDLNSLTWWSLDRPKRLQVIRRMRDQCLNEILSFRKKEKGQLHRTRHTYRLSASDRRMTGLRRNSKRV